jgi:hypothetical protein
MDDKNWVGLRDPSITLGAEIRPLTAPGK